jgi:hypothetical protein
VTVDGVRPHAYAMHEPSRHIALAVKLSTSLLHGKSLQKLRGWQVAAEI